MLVSHKLNISPSQFIKKSKKKGEDHSLAFIHKTIRSKCTFLGEGVHSGQEVALSLTPALPGTGIVFRRIDIEDTFVKALWDKVIDTRMCTVIGEQNKGCVSTVEHILAAVHACQLTDLIIELNHREVPIMDGSSRTFIQKIRSTGIQEHSERKTHICIKKTVRVENTHGWASFKPSSRRLFSVKLDQASRLNCIVPILKTQHFDLDCDDFDTLIAPARTYGFYEDAQKLWDMGLAQGASLENTVVVKDNLIMNENGLRFEDEFTRHKILDAIGDIALAGAPIIGHFEALNPGHGLNNLLLHKLFSDPSNYTTI